LLPVPIFLPLSIMPIHELATIPLVAGSDALHKGSHGANIWKHMCEMISRQSDYQNLFFGAVQENAADMQLFVGKSSPKRQTFTSKREMIV
jgi:hypothetical protein